MLLVGQALNRQGGPAEARKVFADFMAAGFPSSELLPEIKLAIARTDERHFWETGWRQLSNTRRGLRCTWSNRNPALPRAEFFPGLGDGPGGNERLNALPLFS